ncbi:hypothetical protein [Streptomyces sp. enrichment culture]|uniref:hypothetical protein n=1 Tax=Streptomyces sp. enrichment culture TaxID=1795815 RepID=UPI003F5597A4
MLRPDRNNRVMALATDVALTLAPADRERLRKLNDLRKDEELWECERQHERNKRRYLGDDVLKSAGSAVVWWLARHENEIEEAVHMIGPLARIAAAANNEEVPELFRHLLVPPLGRRTEATVGGPLWDESGPGSELYNREEEVGVSDRLRLLLTAAGLKPDMDGYTVFVHRVMRFLQAEGLDEAAAEIRRAFDLPTDEGPEKALPRERDDTASWPPGSPAPEDRPFTDVAEDPVTGFGADASRRRAAGGNSYGGDRGWWETTEADTPPPHHRDSSHGHNRPTAPLVQDEEDGI